MDQGIPWDEWVSYILPYYPKGKRGGSIVDATLINAPSSTKNKNKERDPEMHQTRKGNEWYFGMKCHIGVDAGSGKDTCVLFSEKERNRRKICRNSAQNP
jgi:activator of 2-hydroxyglutaryl-CoA dehydratase